MALLKRSAPSSPGTRDPGDKGKTTSGPGRSKGPQGAGAKSHVDAKAGKKAKGRTGRGGKPKQPRGAKLKQIRQAFTVTRKSDPKLLPLVLAAFFGTFLLLLAIGFVIGKPIIFGVFGVLFGLLVTALVFGRRVQATAYSQVEGQVGAAAAVLNSMRGDWRVTPAVGFTREQDLVHRVLGTAGIVLVAEGSPTRTRQLVSTEKRRLTRIVGQTPVYDVSVGDDEGQVSLRGLEKHFAKLPKNIKGKQVNELDRRLKAIAAPPLPVPKGPMPTRMPRR